MVTKIKAGMTDGIVISTEKATANPTSKPGSGSANKVAILNSEGNLDDHYLPTYVSQWRLTVDFAIGTSEAIVANTWEEADTSVQGTGVGANLTQASGVYTFPDTGKWLVEFHGRVSKNSGDVAVIAADLFATTGSGASTEVRIAQSWGSVSSAGTNDTLCMSSMIDVTDVTENKIKVKLSAGNSGADLKGNSTFNLTYLTFTRLGAT
jgi:hypothetical protein